ncbi:hypothetical protein PYW07_009727 [Mythimna separata]|uniref:Trifunctional nucleotide phosphoesterase protein YfkN n=1 Tax=Mythimna separata TaxID=271217 RepID=A0AAD8DNF1_MYTSE|nr:hypothetical protein PYW07_009727 [Mythimna separata]
MIILVRSVRAMASFAAQAALRSRWSSLIESTSVDVPGEVTDGVRSVVGWLKQASLEVRQVGRRAVSQLAGRGMGDEIVIIHFNDVYNIEQTTNTEPVGGALRFSTAVKAMQHLNPLVLFSGDVFSPSMLSTFTKGEQMVPVLNEIGTHCAVFGNHDFDFGLDVLSGLVAQCNFPWLMSNVIDNETGRPLGDGKITHALMCNGHKIGFIGLVEQEWLETLATINPEEVTFLDFVQAGTKLASQLKQEGCEYVIALTHMRTPNDIKLAEGCNDIDLILGGHDHVYEVLHINNKYVVKSGTDFRQFSKISINFTEEGVTVDISEVEVTSAFAEDLVLKEKTDRYSCKYAFGLRSEVGHFRQFSKISINFTEEGVTVDISEVEVTSAFAEDLVLKEKTDRYSCKYAFGLRSEVGHFRQFSKISINFTEEGVTVDISEVEVTSAFAEDLVLKEKTDRYSCKYAFGLRSEVGHFRQFSKISINFTEEGVTVDISEVEVTSAFAEDLVLKEKTDRYSCKYAFGLRSEVGHFRQFSKISINFTEEGVTVDISEVEVTSAFAEDLVLKEKTDRYSCKYAFGLRSEVGHFRQFSKISINFTEEGVTVDISEVEVTSAFAEDLVLKEKTDRYSCKYAFGLRSEVGHFRQFSKISINFTEEGVTVDISEVEVTSAFAEDLVLKEKTDRYSSMIEGKMDEVLGKICVPLEGRFSCIRRQECNLGNWVCDVLLAATGADLVVLNSGTFRSDQVHAAGDFTLRDLSTIIPMRDPLVVVEATGEVILQVLENAVCKYPSLEGRFPQVCGFVGECDPLVVVEATGEVILQVLENAVCKYPSLEGRFPQVCGFVGECDPLVVVEATGEVILQVLENAVCKYPSLEGRFPQVCGFVGECDPLVVVEATGEVILQVLENAVCKYPSLEGRFPQVCGFVGECDPLVVVEATGEVILQVLENAVCKYPSLEGRYPQVCGFVGECDPLVVVEATGEVILQVLENAVCKYPSLEGRFPQVCGFVGECDPLVVVEATGEVILQVLENAVCKYPSLEGRFPQVCGFVGECDPLVVVEATGEVILQVLENAVCKYPSLEGRFPQVCGFVGECDPLVVVEATGEVILQVLENAVCKYPSLEGRFPQVCGFVGECDPLVVVEATGEVILQVLENAVCKYPSLEGRFPQVCGFVGECDPLVVVEATGEVILQVLENAVCKYPSLEGRFPQVCGFVGECDPLVVVEATGEVILQVLENAVCKYPSLEGRFPQVCGFVGECDPLVVVEATGEVILQVLENAVCKYPSLEGRFPQVCGFVGECDPLVVVEATGEVILQVLENAVCKYPSLEGRFPQVCGFVGECDPLVVVEATGEVILQVLENAVCKYPSLEGRFPQVAGVSFAFDPSKPPGQRVAEQVVKIGDEYLQKEQTYRLAVKQYLQKGNDGFTMLPHCKVIIPEDMCPEIGMAIQNHFAAINVRTGKSRPSKHRQSLVTLSRRHSLVKMLDVSELDGPPPLRRASSAAVEPTSHTGHHRLTRRASLDDLEQQSCELAPKLENRIIVLNKPEELQALIAERTRWESDTVIREVDEGSP